ncbi:MAG: amidase [Luteitalea sp.]|nr:amidase [Luteitalea sp.]
MQQRPFRSWLAGLAVAGVVAAAALAHAPQQPQRFALEEASIRELQQRMAERLDSSRTLVAQYLARIDALDRRGPELRSIIEVNPDALAIADQRDAERRAGRLRGPLHGIPIVIKDNIATGDRMLTTAGSLALAGAAAPRDAFIVERLRESGAVILGKTNMSEWANFRSTRSSSGWSARGGQTRNPYALDRSPSGSSSGSAVAVAASLAAAAIGTETDGSIVSPASNNALVGIKPTVGLVSRTGIVPIAHSQDSAGPMARSVADAVLLLNAIAGRDPADRSTSAAANQPADYARFLDPNGLSGARIGVVRNRLFGYSAAADDLARVALADLKLGGAVMVDPANIPTLGKFDESEFEVLLYEFNAGMQTFLAWLGPGTAVRSLHDIIRFNEEHRAEEMPHFGQEIMTLAAAKGPLSSAEYKKALAANLKMARADGIDLVMKKYRLDALVAPTGGPAWLIDLVNGDGGTAAAPAPSTVAAVAGYPHITVPMGFYRGLPIGLSFFGKAWSEPTLIRIAFAYEQATGHRRPPTFAATAALDGP